MSGNSARLYASLLVLAVAFAPAAEGQALPGQAVFAQRGIALTPANFPRHSASDVDNMFKLGRELGSAAVFVYQWSQPDFLAVARKVMEASRLRVSSPSSG